MTETFHFATAVSETLDLFKQFAQHSEDPTVRLCLCLFTVNKAPLSKCRVIFRK